MKRPTSLTRPIVPARKKSSPSKLRARDRERKLIKKIDKTLQLIKDEEYGWCESCGVEIGIRRLESPPDCGPVRRLQDLG